MPRSPTVLTPPPGTLPFVPNTTIESGKANAVWLDLYQDGNTPRPIAYGGTGASSAQDALNNLGAIGQNNFLAAFSIGDGYWSTRDISAEGGVWLKRDGSLYDSSTYPELASTLPPLPDGVEWTPVATGATEIRSLTPSGVGYLLGARSGINTSIYQSPDGISYSLVATINSFSLTDILYGNGVYLAVDGNGKASLSADGVTWGPPFYALGSGSDGLSGAAFGGGTFVVVGTSGQIRTSIDGASWTSETSGVSALLQSVRYLNNTFVVVGNPTSSNGTILTSPDATTWTLRTSGVNQTLYDVTYGDGLYVCVGSSGTIITSSNLTAWTSRSSLTTVTLNSSVYTTSGFLVVGDAGVARISSAGTAWSATPTGVSSNLIVATADPSRPERYFVAGGGTLLQGIRTLPTQFRVPNDSPQHGWIKAEND